MLHIRRVCPMSNWNRNLTRFKRKLYGHSSKERQKVHVPALVFPEFSRQIIAASHASSVEPPDFRIEVAFIQASLHTRLYLVSSRQLPAPEKKNISQSITKFALRLIFQNFYQSVRPQNLPFGEMVKVKNKLLRQAVIR